MKIKNLFVFAIWTVLIAALLMSFGVDQTTGLIISVAYNAGYMYASRFFPKGAMGAFVGATTMNDNEIGIQVIASERDRVVYEHNKSQVRFAGKNMVPGYLRLESDIKNSTNVVAFKTFEGDGATVYATERRLDRNDAFIITELSVALLKQDTANSKTKAKIQHYPNITEFGAAAASDLWSLYQGYLRITIGRVNKLVAFDMKKFLYVPITQQTSTSNYDAKDGKKDGFVKITPQIIIDGSGTNEIEVNFPSYAGWAGGTSADAGFVHKLVFYARGLHVTGGSQNV